MSGSTNAGEAFDLRTRARRPTAPMPGSFGWSRRRSSKPDGRLPTAIRCCFWRLRLHWPLPHGGSRRSDPRGGVSGGGHTLPLDPSRSSGASGGPVAGGAFRGADQGRKAFGGTGTDQDSDPRQDGTLTDGRPQIVSIETHGDLSKDEVLHYAAALDQVSKHPIAQAIVAAARANGAALPVPGKWSRPPARA